MIKSEVKLSGTFYTPFFNVFHRHGAWDAPYIISLCGKKIMSNYRRVRVSGSTYFLTINVRDRKRTNLTHPAFRQALREGIIRTRQTLPFKMDACVLMPDHLHCIWTLPPNDANYSA